MQTEKMKELGILSIRKMTQARMNFNFAMVDPKTLLQLHDEQSGRKTGKPNRNLEVYKRAGIILSITAWEAFIEDTFRYTFSQRVKQSQSPEDFQELFAAVIQSNLDKLKLTNSLENRQAVESQIREGDWKRVFSQRLESTLFKLNTPDSKAIRKNSFLFLGKDITCDWKWRGVSVEKSCEKLDELIHLRGGLVHRGREVFEESKGATRTNLVDAIKLVENLATCTEKTLGIEVKMMVL